MADSPITITKGISSRIAICSDCSWNCQENSQKTIIQAKNHAIKEKHFVSIETAKYIHYDARQGAGKT